MNATLSEHLLRGLPEAAAVAIEDPLGRDRPQDRHIITTRRALCRVATVAAEAGARFQREANPTDPVAWMLAPRRLFHGAAALDACLDRENFMRAIMLHGLSLGVDADPHALDEVLPDDGADDRVPASKPRKKKPRGLRANTGKLRLFSATVAFADEGTMLQVFHASVASDAAEVLQRLQERLGNDAVAFADIRVGFHPAMPLAIALVPKSVADLIRSVEQDCNSPAVRSFSVHIEQRLKA